MWRDGKTKTSLRLIGGIAVLVALTMSTNATSGEPAQPRDVTLLVTDSGEYILSGSPVALADLRAKLHELKSSGEPINLHVKGGPKAEYKFIMPAIQIAQEEGLSKVGLLTVPGSSASSASRSSK